MSFSPNFSTVFHLASTQTRLHESLVEAADSGNLEHPRLTSQYQPISVHVYPKVPESPPFPFLTKAPALVTAGEKSTTDPYIRSATGVSYTRTLELLRREIGPHFELEKLWEKHTYYVRIATFYLSVQVRSLIPSGIC